MPPSDVARLLSQLKSRYQDQTKVDVNNVLSNYRNLSPKIENYIFPDGMQKDMFCLSGTIPVPYRGNTYNIPIALYLSESHPYMAPICYVRPTSDMTIRQSRHVDGSGRVYMPYLSEWRNTNDLLGAIQVMIIIFGENPPVFQKPKTTPFSSTVTTPVNASSQSGPAVGGPPYPSQGYQPMPRVGNQPFAAPSTQGQTTRPPYPQANPFPSYGPSYSYPYPYSNPPVSQTSTTPSYPYPPKSTSPYPASSNTTPTGTITEQHIRESLLSAVEDKYKKLLREKVAQCDAEVGVLKQTSEDLNRGKVKLDDLIKRMENDKVDLQETKLQLNARNAQLVELITKYEEEGKVMEIDSAFGPNEPLYKQLLNAFAEENAIVDAIYYLGNALGTGVIDLEIFLKNIRELSRRQFMLRVLMQKCREKAGLPY